MGLENEARFQLPEDKLMATIDRLNSGRILEPFRLAQKGFKQHADTYFDSADEMLLGRGWSLRLRRSDGSLRATLKRPAGKANEAFGDLRGEIENQDSDTHWTHPPNCAMN
jgi:inorganic triphosphatase YgiF